MFQVSLYQKQKSDGKSRLTSLIPGWITRLFKRSQIHSFINWISWSDIFFGYFMQRLLFVWLSPLSSLFDLMNF